MAAYNKKGKRGKRGGRVPRAKKLTIGDLMTKPEKEVIPTPPQYGPNKYIRAIRESHQQTQTKFEKCVDMMRTASDEEITHHIKHDCSECRMSTTVGILPHVCSSKAVFEKQRLSASRTGYFEELRKSIKNQE